MFKRFLAAAVALVLAAGLGSGISASGGNAPSIAREIVCTGKSISGEPAALTCAAQTPAAEATENCILPYYWTFGQTAIIGETMRLRTLVNDTGLTDGYQILEVYAGTVSREELAASAPVTDGRFPCAGGVNVIDFTWATAEFEPGNYTLYYRLTDAHGAQVADSMADVYLSPTAIPLERIDLYVLELDSTPESLAAGYGETFSVAVRYTPYHTTADRSYVLESTDPSLLVEGAVDYGGTYPGFYGLCTPNADGSAEVTAACGDFRDSLMVFTRGTESGLSEIPEHASGHTPDETGITVEKAPTATRDGLGYATCAYCGKPFTTVLSKVFSDTNGSAYYADAVDYCYANHIISGMTSTAFGPQLALTRGMLVTMLYRHAGEPDAAASAGFTDVAPSKYYYAPVAWAGETGLVNGYPDGTFRPDSPITREQLVTILFRYVQMMGADNGHRASLVDFRDQDQISPYAREAMEWSVANQVVNGITADTLAPKGNATRAQTATVLYRVITALLA